MVTWRKVALAFAIALAGLDQLSRGIDAKAGDHVLGPAVTVALARQPAFGGEHAVAFVGADLADEVGFLAEQSEAVLDLPDDLEIAGAGGLTGGRIDGGKGEYGSRGQDDEDAHHSPEPSVGGCRRRCESTLFVLICKQDVLVSF